MIRGQTFVPTRITERIGEAISRIGREFSVSDIRRECPDLPWKHIWQILRNKLDQGVVERTTRGRYELLEEPFARMAPTAFVSEAAWSVLWEHRRHPLTRPEIVSECAARSGRQVRGGSVSTILTIWRRKGALVRTGVRRHYYYRLAEDVNERPVTSERRI